MKQSILNKTYTFDAPDNTDIATLYPNDYYIGVSSEGKGSYNNYSGNLYYGHKGQRKILSNRFAVIPAAGISTTVMTSGYTPLIGSSPAGSEYACLNYYINNKPYKWWRQDFNISFDGFVDFDNDFIGSVSLLTYFSSLTLIDAPSIFEVYPNELYMSEFRIIFDSSKYIYLYINAYVNDSGTIRSARSTFFLCNGYNANINVKNGININVIHNHSTKQFKVKINNLDAFVLNDILFFPLGLESRTFTFMEDEISVRSSNYKNLIDNHVPNAYSTTISSFQRTDNVTTTQGKTGLDNWFVEGTGSTAKFTSFDGSVILNGESEYTNYFNNQKKKYCPITYVDNLKVYNKFEADETDFFFPIDITVGEPKTDVIQDLLNPISIQVKEDLDKDLLNPIEIIVGKYLNPIDLFNISITTISKLKPLKEIEDDINKRYLGTQQAAEDFQLLMKVTETSYWPVEFTIDNNYHIHIKPDPIYIGATLYACTNKQFLYHKYAIT